MSSNTAAPNTSSSVDSGGWEDRRTHKRYEVNLDGELSWDGKQFSPCQIRDFCRDGMLLIPSESDGDDYLVNGKHIDGDDCLILRFTADLNHQRHTAEAHVRVVRTVGIGIGISFGGENPESLWRLIRLVQEVQEGLAKGLDFERMSRTPASPMPVEQAINAGQLLEDTQERVERFLVCGIEGLFEEADDRLFSNSGEATSDAHHVGHLEVMREIKDLRAPVETAFLDAVSRDLGSLRQSGTVHPSENEDDQELALVDSGRFDDWVEAKNIITRAEADLSYPQFELNARMTKLVNAPIDEDNNPIGLMRICLGFHDSIQDLSASRNARHTLLEAFEHTIVKNLANLYTDLNAKFVEAGVLPTLARNQEIINSTEHRKRPEAPIEQPSQVSDILPQVEYVGAEGTESVSSVDETEPAITIPVMQLHSAFRAAGNLIAMQSEPEGGKASQLGNVVDGLATWSPTPATLEQQQELLESLSILQRSPRFAESTAVQPLDLQKKLKSTWRSAGLDVSSDQQMMLKVVSNLIDAIMDDPFVHDELKVRVQRLAIPLFKVALHDPGFFDEQMHPARRVLDSLGRIDPQAIERLPEKIDPIVAEIIKNYDHDISVFARVLPALRSLVSHQKRQFQQNLEKVVSEREQQQILIKERQKEIGDPEASTSRNSAAESTGATGDWARWLHEAERRKAGDVIAIEDQPGERQNLSVAWVSEDKGTYVLVDALGNKAMSLTTQELAMRMKRGTAIVKDAAELALVERGTYRMLRSLHKQLARKASHDQLTDVLTRKEFEARLDELVTDAVRGTSRHTVYALDLEGLDTIIEKAGKRTAKGLLKKLAKVIEKQVTNRGVVARLGTARFAVALDDTTIEDGKAFAERHRATIAKARCMWRGEAFPITASVGLLEITEMSKGVTATIKAIESALARAAKAGGDCVKLTSTIDDPHEAGGVLGAGRTAILDMLNMDNLVLRCQRVVPLAEDDSVLPHIEILLGVQQEEGLVSLPADFIRAAERSHQMQMVDRWVISTTFKWISENLAELENVDAYSINLSSNALSDDRMLEFVLAKFSESMVPPAKIIFEFPETAATRNVALTTDFVRTLNAYGCRFAIDDFGMADSSFSYLNSMPVDFIKIDGKLVVDILESHKDLAVVRSINEIGHFLGKQTIAEFVENDDILAQIRKLGVDYAQGFGIEKPKLLWTPGGQVIH